MRLKLFTLVVQCVILSWIAVPPALAQSFQQVPGSVRHIAVGNSAAVWGINALDQIFMFQ